ncbi:hypothetical protein [Parasulfuritortus cantonensis]|uniref:hypothetical protein n=1 Tax=Parasulfuritortus cantonensis TaxID=2528202 RepID=UPI001981D5EC|nr:hypothetical protein [Parasulfuritortus cantonensis]
MTRLALLLSALAIAGQVNGAGTIGAPRPAVLRDVEGYAIASCLARQDRPYLMDQGDAWASVIVQRMKGDVNVLAGLAEQVQAESARGRMAVIRDEANPGKDKMLPVLYCSEIIDRPTVRAAIEKAVAALAPSYGRE